FAKHTARPAISTLSLHDALPIWEILAGKGVVATVSGYETNPSLNKRCQGFKEELEKKYPGIEVKDTRYAYNSNAIAENITREMRSEEHTSELQSRFDLVCRLLLE